MTNSLIIYSQHPIKLTCPKLDSLVHFSTTSFPKIHFNINLPLLFQMKQTITTSFQILTYSPFITSSNPIKHYIMSSVETASLNNLRINQSKNVFSIKILNAFLVSLLMLHALHVPCPRLVCYSSTRKRS
jgi:hypothetical protein